MNLPESYRFFALPTQGAHESWLAFVPPELCTAAKRSGLGTLVLSRFLADRLALPSPDELIVPEESRWTLAEPWKLLDLARRAGSLALYLSISQCIERSQVCLLKAALGDELYRETLMSRALRLEKPPAIPDDAWSSEAELRSFVEHVGVSLLLSTLPARTALRRRAELAFPDPGAARVLEIAEPDRLVAADWLRKNFPGE